LSAQERATRLMASLAAIANGEDGTARREAIITHLRTLGVEPVVEPFNLGRGAGANIVVTVPGKGTQTILIGAHYDRVTEGRGVVDNGAACAALIELIAAFSASPLTQSTLRVVFFDLEETGHQGSRSFLKTGGRIDYALNIDVFAYGDAIFAVRSHPNGVLLKSLRTASEATGLPARDFTREEYPGSDHVSMMAAGIETLGIALIDAAEIERVVALEVKGDVPGVEPPPILRIIHTADDTLVHARPDQISRGVTLVERLIRTVDSAR
jgi:Zn-dependent M28 family amino/carboxypeptidase